MMDKGVLMKPLLESRIYNYTFDYDEWPSISTNTARLLKPYNESIFKLRYKYKSVFRDLWQEEEVKLSAANSKKNKTKLKRAATLKGDIVEKNDKRG